MSNEQYSDTLMRALVLNKEGLRAHDVPLPAIHPDEVLLRVRLAGICNTDLELCRGYKGYNGILGHEFVAEVVQGGDEWQGRRVVGEINIACGTCAMCRRGVPTQCLNRRTVGMNQYPGAFAEYMPLPIANLHPVPDGLRDEQAVFTEPLAAALQILESVSITPEMQVILIGAGKLGLLAAQVVKGTGAALTVVARREGQRQLLERWGIAHAAAEDIPPRAADVVIDCTGTAEGFTQAQAWVRPRGTICLKSTYAGLPQVDMTRVVVDEVRVVGSRCGPFPAALRLLAAGMIDTDSLIEAEYPLIDGVRAFEHAARPRTLKILLRP